MEYEDLPLSEDPRLDSFMDSISNIMGEIPEGEQDEIPNLGVYAIVIKRHFIPKSDEWLQEFCIIDTTLNAEEKKNCVTSVIKEDKELGELKLANIFEVN